MAWKLYSFGAGDRLRYLESEADYDDAGLEAEYDKARYEVLAGASLLDRVENRMFIDAPWPSEVLGMLVAAHGFRLPEPAARV